MRNFSEKSHLFCSILTLTKLKYFISDRVMLHLLAARRSEQGTRNRHEIVFRMVWTIYMENVDEKMNFFSEKFKPELKTFKIESLKQLSEYLT